MLSLEMRLLEACGYLLLLLGAAAAAGAAGAAGAAAGAAVVNPNATAPVTTSTPNSTSAVSGNSTSVKSRTTASSAICQACVCDEELKLVDCSHKVSSPHPSAKRRHRNDVDFTPTSILCRFTCHFRLESSPKIDILATFDVESTLFRCRHIFPPQWDSPRLTLSPGHCSSTY